MPTDSYHLNLAGEYRACSELLKRGIWATVTYGNRKCCDVVAYGPNRRTAVIEVKTSRSLRFGTKFYQKFKLEEHCENPDFWVLCSIKNDHTGFTERFFILTHAEMAEAQASSNDHLHLPYKERVELLIGQFDHVDANNNKYVAAHENAWHKIVNWCSESL